MRAAPAPGGTPISVGGRHATWLVQNGAPQEPSLGETEAITVVVPVPATHGGWDQLTALLRGPHTTALETQVRSMLRSVRLHS